MLYICNNVDSDCSDCLHKVSHNLTGECGIGECCGHVEVYCIPVNMYTQSFICLHDWGDVI